MTKSTTLSSGTSTTVLDIDISDLIAEAAEEEKGLKTTSEIAAEAGVTLYAVKKALRQFQASGQLVVGRKKVRGLDGRSISQPAYKVVGKGSKTWKKQ